MRIRSSWRSFLALGACCLAVTTAQGSSLQTIAKRLVKGLDQLQPKRIAVLTFPYSNGDVSSGSSIVAERLTTVMVERGAAVVVERALLDKAMGEIKLGMTGALDQATTQKLGKILGVSAVVTGTLNDLGEQVTEVNARLIQTETGAILAAAQAEIDKTWTDKPHPPRTSETTHSEDEPSSSLHMSKAIPTRPARRSPLTPIFSTSSMEPAPVKDVTAREQDVLTLNNDDLVSLNQREQNDPERLLNDYVNNRETQVNDGVQTARRIYQHHPDPRIRARALMAMGHLWERSGRPDLSARAYNQILKEFPDAPTLQNEARQQMSHLPAPN